MTSKGAISPRQPDSIQQMFGSISKRYDWANAIISLGLHFFWKRRLIREAQLKPGARVLDCATGTGDLAFLFERSLNQLSPSIVSEVIATDFCEPMLKVARARAVKNNSQVQFTWADVTQLKYADRTFDCASISFGIRNVTDPAQGLRELARVVRPGGRVLVLETGQPQSRWLLPAYRFYTQYVLPRIGGWISGDPVAYRYLQTSSASFPSGAAFLQLAQELQCFHELRAIPFLGGTAYLYVFTKE